MKPCFDSLSPRFKLWFHSWPYVPESTTINPCLKRVIFYPTCPELPTFLVASNLKDHCSFPDHISKIFRYDNFWFLDISLKFTRSLVFLSFTVPADFPASQLYSFLQTESITWPIVMHLAKKPGVQATFYRHAFPAYMSMSMLSVGKHDIFSRYPNYVASQGLL